MGSDPASPEATEERSGLPRTPRTWWIGAAVVVGVTVLVIVLLVIPVLGGRFPRLGAAMVHEDDPQTSVQSDGSVLVSTHTVQAGDIEQVVTYTGTVVPLYEEEVRPRVEAPIKALYVDDGDEVKAGQVLAVLDDVELTARARAAQAGWTSASQGAQAALASEEAARAEWRGNRSKLEAAQSAAEGADAMVAEAEAMVREAQSMYGSRGGGVREAEAMVARAQAMADQGKSMVEGKQAALTSAQAAADQAVSRQAAARQKLEAAATKREQARAKQQGSGAMIAERESDVRSAEADLAFKQSAFQRDDSLYKDGGISKEEWEASRREVEMARGMRDGAVARVQSAKADAREADAMISEAAAMEREAQAMLDESGGEIAKMRADAEMARTEVDAARKGLEGAAAELEAARSRKSMAESELSGEKAAVDAAQAKLDQARAKAGEMRAMAREADAMVDRAHKMVLEAQAMSRQASAEAAGAYQQYLAEKQVEDYTIIRAQTSGKVTKREVDAGTLVGPSMRILSIATYNAVRIQVKVAETHLKELQAGDAAYVHRSDDRADVVIASVTTVFPDEDAETRTGLAEIVLDNPEFDLKKDGFVRVDLVLKRHEGVPVIPTESVQERDGRKVVFVTLSGAASMRPVVTDIDNGVMTEVVTGVQPGDEVIVRNAALVTDGQAVSTTLAAFGSTPPKDGQPAEMPADMPGMKM
jgi:membrane fusion protein, multidrug efflux system